MIIHIEEQSYQLPTTEENETHLRQLTAQLMPYITYLRKNFMQLTTDEIILMAAIMILDEKITINATKSLQNNNPKMKNENEIMQTILNLTERIEKITQQKN